MIIIEVYVDNIIFGSDDENMSQWFAQAMHNEFEMSLLGELTFFLGLQISQLDDGIFISHSKYGYVAKICASDKNLVGL